MRLDLFSGVFDLPWWGLLVLLLALTHITIVAVSVFLHRHKGRHALALHQKGVRVS
jgi:stearoyl-CoA desaturase (delta-9 desaturase)